MPALLISATAGSSDPTRASIPFHIAANGSAASGVECALVLMGDATELVREEIRQELRGVGLPPLADLMASCEAKGLHIYI